MEPKSDEGLGIDAVLRKAYPEVLDLDVSEVREWSGRSGA